MGLFLRNIIGPCCFASTSSPSSKKGAAVPSKSPRHPSAGGVKQKDDQHDADAESNTIYCSTLTSEPDRWQRSGGAVGAEKWKVEEVFRCFTQPLASLGSTSRRYPPR